MDKKKFKLRYVYEGGATMTEFYNTPVIGIMLENETHLCTKHGSKDEMTAAEALNLAKENGCTPINLKDFSEVRKRQVEIRHMFAQAGSPSEIEQDFIWTQDPETGVMEAYSLTTGYMMQYDTKAGVIYKH